MPSSWYLLLIQSVLATSQSSTSSVPESSAPAPAPAAGVSAFSPPLIEPETTLELEQHTMRSPTPASIGTALDIIINIIQH